MDNIYLTKFDFGLFPRKTIKSLLFKSEHAVDGATYNIPKYDDVYFQSNERHGVCMALAYGIAGFVYFDYCKSIGFYNMIGMRGADISGILTDLDFQFTDGTSIKIPKFTPLLG